MPSDTDRKVLSSPLDFCKSIQKHFRDLWEERALTDYTIESCDGVKFEVHKAYMAASSDYFKAMLTGGMVESNTDSVTLHGVHSAGLGPIIDYIYGGDICVSEDNMSHVLNTAAHLQIHTIGQQCGQMLTDMTSFDNFTDVLEMSKLFDLHEAKDAVVTFIISNLEKLVVDGLHVKMSPDDMINILRDDRLPCHSEYEAYTWAKAWIEHDPESRIHHCKELLQQVRFPLLPEEILDDISQTDDIVSKSSAFQELVKEAREYQSLSLKEKVYNQNKWTSVRNRTSFLTFISSSEEEPCRNMLVLQDDEWTPLALDLDVHFLGSSVVTVNNFLIVCGGFDADAAVVDIEERDIVDTCLLFDPRTCNWSTLPPMLSKRIWFPLVASQTEVFAVGGTVSRQSFFSPNLNTDSIEKYSFKTNRWEQVGALEEKLERSAACVYKEKIYISGGIREDQTFSKGLHVFDPNSGCLEKCADSVTSHSGHTLAVCGDNIHLIDSFFHPGLIECFNVPTGQWTMIDLPLSQYLPNRAKVAVHGDIVYFTHDERDFDDYGPGMKLNLRTNERTDLPGLPEDWVYECTCLLALPRGMLDI